MLSGEEPREFVMNYGQERLYLENAPQPLHDVAMLILDTGLRVGEALGLTKADIKLGFAKRAKFGALRVREGKSKNAGRYLLLTERVQSMLKTKMESDNSIGIFPDRNGNLPYRISSLDHQHKRVRRRLHLPEEAVIHSLRHTHLTRLGESGADAFTIMKIAGHSSITVSEKYVQPSSESMERVFERLQKFNEGAYMQLPATISATVANSDSQSSIEGGKQVLQNQRIIEYAPVAQVDRATVS